MSLVAGRGPFGGDRAGWFTPDLPQRVVYIEPHPRRIQAFRDGAAVIDTELALMVHRDGHPLSYAFPAGSTSDLPTEPVPEAPGYVRVSWDAVDAWIEEGRALVHYPPNPYHRVDCRPTRRRLTANLADVTLVDTDDTVIVFETSLSPRLYVSPTHVRTDLLRGSPTTSYCNYKGEATYWSAVVNDTVIEDVAWSYDNPLPESLPITGYLSFDAKRVALVAELPPADGGSSGCDT